MTRICSIDASLDNKTEAQKKSQPKGKAKAKQMTTQEKKASKKIKIVKNMSNPFTLLMRLLREYLVP